MKSRSLIISASFIILAIGLVGFIPKMSGANIIKKAPINQDRGIEDAPRVVRKSEPFHHLPTRN